MNKPRNLAARSPLLRKGGAHERSKSAHRFAGKRALSKQLDDLGRAPGDKGRCRQY